MPDVSADEWVAFLSKFPDAHLLQSHTWGELKNHYGWEVAWIISNSQPQGGAQILYRQLLFGLKLAYIPKGPLGEISVDLWREIDAACRERGSAFLKVEPDCWQDGFAGPGLDPPEGFRLSLQAIQPPRTLVVDLRGNESQVLARMKQKTRYNIRLAVKKGVRVVKSSDLELFYQLMVSTGQRGYFGVHTQDYYHKAFELFHPKGECELFLAEYDGDPLASLMVFAHGRRAWYFYGASREHHRERMPSYLLQWEAMRWARSLGCVEYDLWGVPDADEATLEANYLGRNDGLWGVYRFKRGFGGQLRRALGPWDRVYLAPVYLLYQWWVKHKSPASVPAG